MVQRGVADRGGPQGLDGASECAAPHVAREIAIVATDGLIVVETAVPDIQRHPEFSATSRVNGAPEAPASHSADTLVAPNRSVVTECAVGDGEHSVVPNGAAER